MHGPSRSRAGVVTGRVYGVSVAVERMKENVDVVGGQQITGTVDGGAHPRPVVRPPMALTLVARHVHSVTRRYNRRPFKAIDGDVGVFAVVTARLGS